MSTSSFPTCPVEISRKSFWQDGSEKIPISSYSTARHDKIDIKVKQDIYQLMNQMRKNGKSIIMISEELMELIGMCDRIMIMKDGKISGELERDQNLDENGLITMMV